MRLLAILAAIAVAIWAADRLLLAAEARGWIYYRRKKASPGTRASAMLELQSMLEPGKAHELHAVQSEEEARDESGDPPSPEKTMNAER